MKKFIERFRVPSGEKISDKTFTYNVIAGVLGILLCLSSLTAATWAWFGSSTSSGNNKIQSGQYDVSRTVSVNSGAASTGVEVTANEQSAEVLVADAQGVYTLEEGKEYHVELTGTGNVTSGYCVLTLTSGNKTEKHTQQIYTKTYCDNNTTLNEVPTISFDLLIDSEVTGNVSMTIEPYWGTSALSAEEKVNDTHKYTYDGTAITDTTPTESTDGSRENNTQ